MRELVHHRPDVAREVYLTAEAEARYPEILSAALAAGVSVRRTSEDVMVAMSGDAQGVLGVADLVTASLDTLGAVRLVAVLAHVRDPGNAGAVVRAADAAGADAVVLAGDSVDLHNPKVVRSTAGSLFHLPVVTGVTVPQALGHLRERGVRVLAADGQGVHDLDALQSGHDVASGHADGAGTGGDAPPSLADRTAWLFGNEAWGLTDEDRALSDAVVRVPIHGLAESLNLATAAVLCLYASARCQRASGHRCDRAPGLRT